MNVTEIEQSLTASLAESDLHLLPRNMRVLVSVIGLPATIRLIKHHGGGSPVLVPKNASDDHPLRELLGAEAFASLIKQYAGVGVEIAKCDKAARILWYRQIKYEHFTLGHTQDALAMRHGITVRHVRNIAYYLQEPNVEDDRQCGLF